MTVINSSSNSGENSQQGRFHFSVRADWNFLKKYLSLYGIRTCIVFFNMTDLVARLNEEGWMKALKIFLQPHMCQ